MFSQSFDVDKISIHAPLTGSDIPMSCPFTRTRQFQSTLPLRGATRVLFSDCRDHIQFQSTLPLRGATPAQCPGDSIQHDFNPRSPYGERRKRDRPERKLCEFQSTLPLRGATCGTLVVDTADWAISIHAPLTGSDLLFPVARGLFGNFNPRSPYGERHIADAYYQHPEDFNPRSPYGERQGGTRCVCRPVYFNPRSPYGERQSYIDACRRHSNFNPRSPYGERLLLAGFVLRSIYFNPRSPYGERLLISR